MKKIFFAIFFIFIYCDSAFSDSYFFNGCKLSNVASGNYIINFDKKVIETTLTAADGRIQTYSDKIKTIEKHQIITEKIPSGKGDQIFFEYYLNSKTKKVIKIQYKKQSDGDIDIYQIQEKRESECAEVSGGWNKNTIEKKETDKEQERIIKAQKKIKKEQSSVTKCYGDNYKKWTNCTGLYKNETGHLYEGIFKSGQILKGTALFFDGAQYVGDFKLFKPHGYGNFVWSNGNKYFGEWTGGKMNGNGTKLWNDGREYSGTFKNDKLHGSGTLYYPDGKKYVGEFINGKRHGEGTFMYIDGTAFVGKFIAGNQDGLGECIAVDGSSLPCQNRAETQTKDFSGKDTHNISIVSKRWVRVSHYENNSKKGKKIMNKLKSEFKIQASKICSEKGNYKVLDERMEILDIDETPAYGLETKLQIGIKGVVECI